MRRSCGAWMTAAFMAVPPLASKSTIPAVARPNPEGCAMVEPCPLIEVSGPPHARDLQYGRQAASRIRLGIAHYTGQLRRLDMDAAAVANLIRDYLPVI